MRLKYVRNITLSILTILPMLLPIPVNAEASFDEESFRIGYYTQVFPDHSYEDLKVAVKILAEEIGNQIGIKTMAISFDNLTLMRKEFEQGKINFVLASSLILAKDFDNNQFANGFRFTKANNVFDTLAILTRKNEKLDNLNALQGKRLTVVENNQIADIYMETLSLTNFKKNYEATFKEIKKEKKSSQIILKLFFGKTDVICVYKNNYELASELNPQLEARLQIVSELKDIPQAIGFFHINTQPAFREKVIAEIVNMDKYAKGQQLLEAIKLDRAVRANIDDLIATKNLYADYQRLKHVK